MFSLFWKSDHLLFTLLLLFRFALKKYFIWQIFLKPEHQFQWIIVENENKNKFWISQQYKIFKFSGMKNNQMKYYH